MWGPDKSDSRANRRQLPWRPQARLLGNAVGIWDRPASKSRDAMFLIPDPPPSQNSWNRMNSSFRGEGAQDGWGRPGRQEPPPSVLASPLTRSLTLGAIKTPSRGTQWLPVLNCTSRYLTQHSCSINISPPTASHLTHSKQALLTLFLFVFFFWGGGYFTLFLE